MTRYELYGCDLDCEHCNDEFCQGLKREEAEQDDDIVVIAFHNDGSMYIVE